MIEAWLEALQDHLRLRLDATAARVGIQPEGHPPASMGDWYVSVDEQAVQSGERASLSERYTVAVYVTRRTGVLPQDRRSKAYIAQSYKLSDLERRIVTAVHGSQVLRILANEKLGISLEAQRGEEDVSGADSAFGWAFQLPLYYTGRSRTAFMGAEWIASRNEDDTFMVRTLLFSEGLRVQSLAVMK